MLVSIDADSHQDTRGLAIVISKTALRRNSSTMELGRCDSIQLLSVSDFIEIYYSRLRNAMEKAASEAKHKNGFDGNLLEEDAKNLTEFCEANQVPYLSQALAEVLTCMERRTEKKIPEVRETDIYNSLLRLEKAVNNTSSWELCEPEEDALLLNLTNFEKNTIEQQISLYITDMLNENTSEILFFPLVDFYSSNIIVKWRILEKILTIKLLPHKTIYKEKLKYHMKERLKTEVNTWLNKEIEKMKLSNSQMVRKDVEAFTKILKDLQSQINMTMDVALSETLFQGSECNYFEVLSDTVDETLFPICQRVMELMDSYQVLHRDYHVNMRDSCALSHALYLQLKKLTTLLTSHRVEKRHLKLENYTNVFAKFFVNLLQVIKLECHNRIKRAVQVETKDNVHIEEKILSSSVIVLNCICTVIDEWKHLEIEDDEQRIAFLVKIADIVCDGTKIFAESLECRLQSMNAPVKDLEGLKKICILGNSVEHVLQYLQELPQQMLWLDVLKEDNDEETETSLKQQVLRILNLIHDSMNKHISEIIARMINSLVNGIYNVLEKMFVSWLQSQATFQAFEKFFAHMNEVLEFLDGVLKEKLFPHMLSHLWSCLLSSIQERFQEGQHPEYARTVKQNVLDLKIYFGRINMSDSDTHKPLLQKLMDVLDLNSKTTEELQLDYYTQVAETIISPVEYLGHIAFQAGYKVMSSDTVNLYICVQKGQRLPARKFEMSQLIAKVELCPSTLFPSHVPYKTSAVNEDLDNPVFSECFEFLKLPTDTLDVKGAAIQVLVLNQDYSYSAESILLLNQVQNMSGIASLDFLPVYLMPLRKFDMSHISYQVLENRSRWDKNAKVFINKRAKLSKSHRKFLPCIPGKNIMCSFSRND